MKLYKHQKIAVGLLNTELKVHNHVLFGAPTGFGKSVVIKHCVKKDILAGLRVLVVAPRRTLIKQLKETLVTHTPFILMGSHTNTIDISDARLIVGSLPTIGSRLSQHKNYLENIDKIYIDEAHIAFHGESMQRLKDRYWDNSKWIGFSATPIDADGYRLEGWDKTIYPYQTPDLIMKGFLAPVEVFVTDKSARPDLESLSMQNGDYKIDELSAMMNDDGLISNTYKIWKKYNRKKLKTIVFAVDILHAENIVTTFKKKYVNAAVIHSKMPESKATEILKDFKNDKYKVIVNVGMLTTGFDDPSVECLLLARPTKSVPLAIQIFGRVLRIWREKPNKVGLILDCAGMIDEHGSPIERRNFNRVRPPKKKLEDGEEPEEFSDMVCPECGAKFQLRDCEREVIRHKKATEKKYFCPTCSMEVKVIFKEDVEVEKMVRYKNYENMKKVKRPMYEDLLTHIANSKGYKSGWVYHKSKLYDKKDKLFMESIKGTYYKLLNNDITIETALKHIKKLDS